MGSGSGSGDVQPQVTTTAAPPRTDGHTAEASGDGSGAVRFSKSGPLPAVQAAAPSAGGPPSASERAFDPPSRTATWPQVSQAADQDRAKQDLDIAWIDQLPEHLRNSIDTEFADDTASAKLSKETRYDDGLKKVDKDIDAKEAALKAAVKERLKKDHPKVTDAQIKADPEYVQGIANLEIERGTRRAGRVTEISQADDASIAAGKRDQSVTAPPTATIKRGEGKALARTNFMSWAVDVMGSAGAVKAHFLGISPVSRQPGMWLAKEAKARFEAARADFESKHAGYTFPDTDVAQSMRGLHQTRQGLGMLGHALGVAFDFLAVDNPNIKIEKPTKTNYSYMLNKFGGANAEQHGRSTMSLTPTKGDAGYGHTADATIEQLGKDTVAGKSTPEGEAIAQRAVAQFDEMVATSHRFQASMAGNLPELQEARDLYFNLGIEKGNLAKLQATAAHGHTAEIKAQAAADAAALDTKIQQEQQQLKTHMQHAFQAWHDGIAQDIAKDDTGLAGNAASSSAMTNDQHALVAIDAKAAEAMDQLTAFATAHGLSTPDQLKKPPKDATAYKKLLAGELGKKQSGEQARISGSARDSTTGDAYYKAEKTELETWQARLENPDIVFGHGKQQPDGHWASRYDVTNVPVMQMIEHGFVHDDEMPASEGKGGRKQVFNHTVVETLVRFGWSPGATYGDTMHFDFIEGYSLAAPGGRSPKNMEHTRYSPEGDLSETAKKK